MPKEVADLSGYSGKRSISKERLGMVQRTSIVTLLGLLLAACSALLDDRLISTSEGSVEVSSTPGPPPTIVFEAGLAAYKETWNKVYPAIASSHAVFAYDRAGVGKSTTSTKPRDGATIVADLRRLLTSQGISPPYVLVGHSAGGLYMQMFARLHPTEIAGLVLVDPTHPTQFEGDGTIERRGLAASALIAAARVIGPAQAEFNALPQTGRDVIASPALPRTIPVIILIAPDPSGSAIAAFDNAKRADFARLYPRAAVHVVKSGHDVQQDAPKVIIDAIDEVIARWRATISDSAT